MLSTYIHLFRNKKSWYQPVILLPLFCLLACCLSCKKNDFSGGNPSVLQVFNAMDNAQHLYINFSGARPAQFATSGYVNNQQSSFDQTEFTTSNMFTLPALSTKVEFYSQQDTLPHDKPLISTSMETAPGASYLMFIIGTKSNPDFSVVKDSFPSAILSDSSFFIRFSNISEESPVSVNIKGQAVGSLVQQLPFKSSSGFHAIRIDKNLPDYEFEIRDQASGTLITSYHLIGINSDIAFSVAMMYQPLTLILTGRAGAAPPNEQKIKIIKHRATY